jgi:hypothetical protein
MTKSIKSCAAVLNLTSKPPEEHKNDDDDQDDADDADAAVSVAVTVATEAATKAAEQENDEDDYENESDRHDLISFCLRQLKPHAEAKAVQNCSYREAVGLAAQQRRPRIKQDMRI